MSGIQVNDANFEQEVLQAQEPVLVDFWAEWCAPCKMIAPVVEELAGDYAGRVKVCSANVDEAPQSASKYGIMSIPTLMIFKGGDAIDKITGAVPKAIISEKLDSHL